MKINISIRPGHPYCDMFFGANLACISYYTEGVWCRNYNFKMNVNRITKSLRGN
jgi:hypothetical protein